MTKQLKYPEFVERMFACKERIAQTRSAEIPKCGDIVQYTNRFGDYNANASLKENTDGTITILKMGRHDLLCADKTGITFYDSTQQGLTILKSQLRYLGSKEKSFRLMRTDKADDTMPFKTTVSVWEYTEPNPVYGEYSSRDWCKAIVPDWSSNDSDSYFWGGTHFVRYSDKEDWLRYIRGVMFDGKIPGQKVIFHYRERFKPISKRKWDNTMLPVSSRLLGGQKMPCKFSYDNNSRIVTIYWQQGGDLCHEIAC